MELSRRLFIGASLAALAERGRADAHAAVFPYGTHVYREPSLPLDAIEADLPLLKRLGFTMIKIQESWSADERREGEIDLSRVERVVAGARTNGLLVYFGITMEQAPAWLWRKYPDAQMVYEDGTPHNDPTQYLLPADGKPGPCWHHPGARAAGSRFVEALAGTVGKYDNILIWNAFQEIGFWPLRPGHPIGFCYCKHTLSEFRLWLQKQYGTLDRLNRGWRTSFGEWEEVEPPRSFGQVPAMLDWRYFMDDVTLSENLRWKTEALRRGDPSKRPVMAHTSSPTIGSTADWRYARVLDVFGSSAYPSWGEMEDPDTSASERAGRSNLPYEQLWSGVMLKFDYARSASVKGEIWTAELQGGRAGGGVFPGRVPDAGDIRRWTLGSLACGVRGICFWNHRSEPFWSETSGFGLLERTGESTERAAEASRIAKAIAPHAQLFAQSSCVPAQVGIVVWERLYQFYSASGSEIRNLYTQSLRGSYKALWRNGFPVDFVDAEDLAASAGTYKALLLPGPLMLSDAIASALAAYVKSGGLLISDACPGRFDENGFGRPGEMAEVCESLFGARHKQLATSATPPKSPRVLAGAGALAALQVSDPGYLQLLEVTGGTTLLTYRGQAAGCMKQHGAGRAVLIGTFLAEPIPDGELSGNEAALLALLRMAPISPQMSGKLIERRRVLGTKTALFLINPTHESVTERIPAGGLVEDLFGKRLERESGMVVVSVGPLDIACLILEERG